MARFQTRPKFISRGSRRETRWLNLDPVTATLGTGGTAAITHSLTTEELALRPFTVVRTRGVLHVQSDQTAASEVYNAALGIAVVSAQAEAIGVTAVPTPNADRESDLWFLFEEITGQFLFADATGFIEGAGGLIRHFDSKAMRKVEDGQDIVVVIENFFSAGTQVTVSGRMLIKLH